VLEVVTTAWYFDRSNVLRECYAALIDGRIMLAVDLDGDHIDAPLHDVLIERPE
jgi:hypothetical protein